MPRSRPPYPPEFRQQILELIKAGRTPNELAREYEPTGETIRQWVKQAADDEGEDQEKRSSDDRAEITRLRKENQRLRQEREILKKAAAWFAQETNCVPPKSSSS